MTSTPLTEIATVIRSKNAGPYELTLDIVFADESIYRRVVAGQLINAELIAALYRIPVTDVLDLISFDPANAIKITIRRPLVAGNIGDADVYGAQQHAPLLGIHLSW